MPLSNWVWSNFGRETEMSVSVMTVENLTVLKNTFLPSGLQLAHLVEEFQPMTISEI